MRTCFVIAMLTALGVLAVQSASQAQSYGAGAVYGQSNSALGRPGLFGNRTLGGAVSPGMRSFSGGGAGGAMDIGAARYLRENRQPGQVVGFNPEAMQHFVGVDLSAATPGGGFAPTTMYGGGGWPRSGWDAAGRHRQDQQSSPQQPSNRVRTEFRVAFDRPEPGADRLSASLARRLTESRAIQTQSPIRVEVQARTAILRGTVTTEHDRLLAEQIVRLEPGIERVRNELVAESAKPSEPATP